MDTATAYWVLLGVLVSFQFLTLLFVISIRNKKSPPDTLVREGQAKTHSIIYKAISQANKILVAAELKGLQLLSARKITNDELTDRFNEHLNSIEKILQSELTKSAEHAEEAYGSFIKSAEGTIHEHIDKNQKMLEEKSQSMIERTESLLTQFTADLETKVKDDVNQELAKVTKEIDEYKHNRMRIIDERIVDILEEVLRVALDKKLTLVDQSDLIYKALEEAKREHAFEEQKRE